MYNLYRDGPYEDGFRPSMPKLDEFETMFFGPEEFAQIGRVPGERDSEQYLLGMHGEGKRCFGLKTRDEVVSYIWCETRAFNYLGHDIPLETGEAYMFGTYTLRKWRGRNALAVMRYDFTKELVAEGNTQFRSVISRFNTPAIHLKEKLTPYQYEQYLHVALFGVWRKRWLVGRGEGGGT